MMVLLSACADNPQSGLPVWESRESYSNATHLYEITENPDRNRVLSTAINQLGLPYQWGGASPGEGFDCSGLVYFTHQQAGLRVPRRSIAQLNAANQVPVQRIQPGDLVFFRIGSKTSHVGIYMGRSRFIHAPSTGKKVSLASLNNRYWRNRLIAAGNFYR